MFKNYNIAKQYWQYGEIKRSKKRFIYVVKHWALSLQMAKTQKVTMTTFQHRSSNWMLPSYSVVAM